MNIHTHPILMTVLLVDDELMVLDVHRLFLIEIGCKVLTARNGHEAFKIFEQNRDTIDLIVTDYVMPVWDGLKLIQSIREQHAAVPILMITGFAESNNMNDIRNYDVDILHKPVRFLTLAEIIQAQARHHINAKKSKKILPPATGSSAFPISTCAS